jgi:hypothetical protein
MVFQHPRQAGFAWLDLIVLCDASANGRSQLSEIKSALADAGLDQCVTCTVI